MCVCVVRGGSTERPCKVSVIIPLFFSLSFFLDLRLRFVLCYFLIAQPVPLQLFRTIFSKRFIFQIVLFIVPLSLFLFVIFPFQLIMSQYWNRPTHILRIFRFSYRRALSFGLLTRFSCHQTGCVTVFSWTWIIAGGAIVITDGTEPIKFCATSHKVSWTKKKRD